MKRTIAIITMLLFLLSSILIPNKSEASQSVKQTVSSDINSINTSKYPGIKEKIQALQNKYPNWKFKVLYTGLDWNEVISNEYTGHWQSPKNLIYKKANYQGAWICSICGDKAYDNGSWRCASYEAISYMMDPRNSINESDIYQFEELTNTGVSASTIKTMTNGTFLSGHEQGIINAANNNNVNAGYIVARLIQEQGKNGTVLTSGAGYNGQGVGYYNAFNIAAGGNSTAEILTGALAYAKKMGWTTLDKSIDGGINYLASEYIKKGQNTLYFQKFDVEATGGLYSHQYMQNLLAAENEGLTLKNTYINTNSMSTAHTFIIPVYENMPSTACARPNSNGKSNITTDSMLRVNVESTIRLRNAPNGNTTVGWLSKNEIVTRIEKATTRVGGTYWDKVRKSNGTEGYVARETYENESNYKLYLVPLNDNSSSSNTGSNQGNSTAKVKIDKENKIISVSPSAKASDILEAFGGTAKITKADGGYLNGAQDLVATGFIVEDKYTVVKKGDCNGDGNTNSLDAAVILRYTVGQYDLKNCYLKAGAISDGNKATSLDAAKILRYTVGQYNIEL